MSIVSIGLYVLIALVFNVSTSIASVPTATPAPPSFYTGADLSFTNEMQDCGAVYMQDGEISDPFSIFADAGASLVRVRLWVNPDWTDYSNLDDVIITLQRAHDAGMSTLLDFHYSDTWADPAHQVIPAEWAALTDEALVTQVYDYTADVLETLEALDLLPDMVQIGNEINGEILRPADTDGHPINWARNAALINAGIRAARDAEVDKVMLHIAQPEYAKWWFPEAVSAGVTDFDIIGLSYYSGWSSESPEQLGESILALREAFNVDVMVVETAYAWTDNYADHANNNIGADFVLSGYPVTPEGQRDYLLDLAGIIRDSGGIGLLYWGADWLSTPCETQWGIGSLWENATLFDFTGELLPAADFFAFE